MAITVPAAIFGLAMGLFAFFGLPIFSLCLPVLFQFCRPATGITTIALASPAASANAKLEFAPSTLNGDQ
ncbi:MAG: hypothetical protein PVG19_12515 [Desulfobacterales bacterium]|jgi:hypothetical protein